MFKNNKKQIISKNRKFLMKINLIKSQKCNIQLLIKINNNGQLLRKKFMFTRKKNSYFIKKKTV